MTSPPPLPDTPDPAARPRLHGMALGLALALVAWILLAVVVVTVYSLL